MDILRSQTRLQETLDSVRALLEKHRVVESMVTRQDSPKHALVESLVHRQHLAELESRLGRMRAADVAYVLENLPLGDRQLVWQQVRRRHGGEVLLELSDAVRENLIAGMSRAELLAALEQLDADDIAELAEDIPNDVLQKRLQTLTAEDRHWLQSSMTYPEDTVGSLMSNEMVTVIDDQPLEQLLDTLRNLDELPIHNDKAFAVDRRGNLKGVVALQTLILIPPHRRVRDVMATDVVILTPQDKARDAATAFERYDLVSAPVVDERGRLVGRLTIDVIMDFIREESADEVLGLAGLAGEEDVYSSIWNSVRNRLTWLFLNLFTAFIASRVIGLFEGTIAHLVALATLMPIVASIGGNTGNQTTALMIRGIALGQISRRSIAYLMRKEVGVSILNGISLGAVVGLFAYALYDNMQLGLVIAAAMLLNLIIAALVGLAVPLALNKFGRDPALGSSILLTATTDSMGFFIFLGLATVFLR